MKFARKLRLIECSLMLSTFIFLTSCSSLKRSIPYVVDHTQIDYSNSDNWAALPGKKNNSDNIPKDLLRNVEPFDVDIFYLYPTSFTKRDKRWNAPISDQKINKKTDESALKFQASVFNLVGAVYAPRYRQAHLRAYFTKDKVSAKQAFDLAYSDVKNAFLYYLEHFNHNRPFIIASHSQGTTHAERLIKELVDNTPLQKRLVVTYLVGLPVFKNSFNTIKPCESPEETGCLCSWRTYKVGFEPKIKNVNENIAVVNPISWTTGLGTVDKSLHKGSILLDFNKLKPHSQSAQIYKGVVLTNKPKFLGSIFITSKNYHPGDYNLFYYDIQENARLRTKTFLSNQSKN
ncbi:MAG: DUF3089 domain-containing protein [Saprospiraceae bacterium]|jgi:hypothetical protein|nr:DUF3089 domain-containing protein [Saprospiraceae bacterium]